MHMDAENLFCGVKEPMDDWCSLSHCNETIPTRTAARLRMRLMKKYVLMRMDEDAGGDDGMRGGCGAALLLLGGDPRVFEMWDRS